MPRRRLDELDLAGVLPPQLSHSSHCISPIGLREDEDEQMVSDALPMVPGIDAPSPPTVQSRRSASSGGIRLHGTPKARRSTSASEIVTVPPSHYRGRSKSPTDRRSIPPSPSRSEGSMGDWADNSRAPDVPEGFGFEFEVKEQDRWLPIANVARIMKNALPQHAKILKETKECMQECVSEFISTVAQLKGLIAAAEKCQLEKRKRIEGADILSALNSLGFENYAELLNDYGARYRRTMYGKTTSELPRSPRTDTPSATVWVDPALEGTNDAIITKQDAPCGANTRNDQAQKHGYGDWHLQNSGQHTHEAEPRSIVDDLLLQWTSLPKVH
ncbi:MAG: hypothetical protein Q9207_003233 [Kuettlingeria erythrocarpa]